MRSLIVAIMISACGQTADHKPVIDAGITPITHRLQVSRYVTSDGAELPTPNTQFFDTAFSTTCFPAIDAAGDLRCFPNVGYQPSAGGYGKPVFHDADCLEEVFVVSASSTSEVQGVFREIGPGHGNRLNRIGPLLNTGTYYMVPQDGGCVLRSTTSEQTIHSVGEDLTPTLETLAVQWRDSP